MKKLIAETIAPLLARIAEVEHVMVALEAENVLWRAENGTLQ